MRFSQGWFSKIETREAALLAVKNASLFFYIAGTIQLIIPIVADGPVNVLYALLYIVLGFLLQKFHYRSISILLLTLAIISLMVSVANQFGENLAGGNTVILSLIIVWGAFRAVDATFKLHFW